MVLDTAGCIQMSNSMFEKLFLYSREEIFGAKLDDVIVPTELVSEARTLTALCLGGGGARQPVAADVKTARCWIRKYTGFPW